MPALNAVDMQRTVARRSHAARKAHMGVAVEEGAPIYEGGIS